MLYAAGQNGHTNGKSTERSSNGTNGHQPELKNEIAAAPQPETAADILPQPTEPSAAVRRPAAQPGGSWLHITVPRTGDLVQDKHRLRRIYELLVETPGDDGFSIYIPNDDQKIRIDFPNNSTRYTARLQQSLTLILGAKAVRVEQTD